jgi:hypothetical protein
MTFLLLGSKRKEGSMTTSAPNLWRPVEAAQPLEAVPASLPLTPRWLVESQVSWRAPKNFTLPPRGLVSPWNQVAQNSTWNLRVSRLSNVQKQPCRRRVSPVPHGYVGCLDCQLSASLVSMWPTGLAKSLLPWELTLMPSWDSGDLSSQREQKRSQSTQLARSLHYSKFGFPSCGHL